ncbi:elongation of very long chain fatty acids protein AAEL008004-like [Macrosteles quadrilineatus]|uniref:elongation of very long chain fatty acids protein AAEL008004-like n=1 Tax=Macrosteles quadrilineatus TaxID=74068 RepID=UPI0023E08FC1|nr:elongation of very long chain fatty acids protein AAEL008004-like [Macrosteles quadrilineatus]XP_054274965.1 elongation of very long chain fatty acids protein AAEL008004-like [Macrosteles quadrilineatus]
MARLLHIVQNNYQQILNETIEDPIVDSWPLMSSPWPVLSIVSFYLYFVLQLGPALMKTKPAFDLKYVMIVYNFYQVVFSTWMCFRLFTTDRAIQYMIQHGCQPLSKEHNPVQDPLREAAWFYFVSKLIELLDTVFFVLRKKQSQVTFLHVYHHSNLAISTWAYLKYVKGEQGILIGFLNSFVHVVMYLYYLLAALGPSMQKYLWWKKYITKLQLGQFIIFIVYLLTLLAFDCKLPKALTVYMTLNSTVFLYLFSDFYRKAYLNSKKIQQASTCLQKSKSN